MTTAALAFGNLNFELTDAPVGVLASGVPWIAALGKDVDRGNPEAVVAKIASMLMDGDKAEITRHGNQIVRYPIEISGDDLDVVAAGEALVMAEVNKGRNTTTWTPPGPAETNVHDVVYSTLEFHFDDLSENRAVRYFTLVLECVPFARRAEPTVVVAEPIPDEPADWTSIDDCTSTAGWTASNGTLSVVGGDSIYWTPDIPDTWSWAINAAITRAGLSMPIIAGEYVVLEVAGAVDTISFRFNGTQVPPQTQEHVVGEQWRYYFLLPAGTLNEVQARVFIQNMNLAYLQTFDVSKVSRLPFAGTPRQRSFTVEIGGTARTQADLAVETEGGVALGNELLVYTAPASVAFDPPLRHLQVPGTGSPQDPDATAVSGVASMMTVPAVFPVSASRPATYMLLGRLWSDASWPTTVHWSATPAGTPFATDDDTISGSMPVSLTPDWQIFALGVLSLPSAATLTLSSPDGIWSDEFWLVDLDHGVLSWFSDLYASGTHPSRAVMRSASLDSPRPAWLVGSSTDHSLDTDVSRRMESPGEHEFTPGLMRVFVAATNAAVRVTATAYERFMHHVTRRPTE